MSLIVSIILFVLVSAIILWLAQYVLAQLPVPPVIRNLILALIGLLLLLFFLQRVGVLTGLGL